jgi:hypothetical protein
VELVLGLFVLAAPVVLHASTAGIVLGVILGALVMGLAFNGSGVMDGHPERPPLALRAHQHADAGVVAALLAGAVAMLLAGDFIAVGTFAIAAAAQKALELRTQYAVPE